MNIEKLNAVVTQYRALPTDETFATVYAIVKPEWRKATAIAKSIRASREEVIAAYEDTLMACIERWDGTQHFLYFYRSCVARMRTDIYRKKEKLHEREVYESATEEAATLEETLAADFNLEETALATKKADQRQLIDFLLAGADTTTTAIVEAFLRHPKPSVTAIAKELGYHHQQVIRALTRLAAKHDDKQFGNYRDYLVAL